MWPMSRLLARPCLRKRSTSYLSADMPMSGVKAAAKALTEQALNLGSTHTVTALLVPLGPGTYFNLKQM
jgi:hypothetical protein